MELNEAQRDMLKEVGNIGVGHAATALSKMVNDKVDIELPDLRLIDIKSIPFDESKPMVVIASNIEGELNGTLAVLMDTDSMLRMSEILMMTEKGSLKALDDMSKSALLEFVNILSGAYLSSLSDFCGFNLMPQPPSFSDHSLAIDTSKQVLEVKTDFKITGEGINALLYLILDSNGMSYILQKLQ